MRKRISLLAAAAVVVLAPLFAAPEAHAANPWGAKATEWWTDLGYTGEGWFFGNQYGTVNGKKTYCTGAAIRFYAGSPGNRDTGWRWAVKQATNVHPDFWLVSVDYWDDFSWDPGYKTQFRSQFTLKTKK